MSRQGKSFKGLSLLVTTLAAAAFALGGCNGGDGSTGPAGPAGATGPAGAAGAAGKDLTNVVKLSSNATPASADAAAAWAALAPQVTISSVTIASPPVVKFSVKDASGNAIVGLGNKSQASTATVAGLTNISFTLAKLMPGTNGAPSKWVSYNVVRPPTVAEKTAVPATASCDKASAPTWCGTFPAVDNQGTLKDNGDGSYEYTFYRDPKQAAAIVASLIDSVDGLAKKADLGDVNFDPTLTHRLGIQIGGAAPGTGSNNPSGSATGAPATVNMVNTANAVFDFRPDGGTIANTRDIVKIDSCSECHAGKVLAHGSRKDPKYCVTCHTDQIRYTFSQEASSTNGGLTLTGTTRPTTAVVDGRALGNYPNMIHHIHMGEELVKQGYNFNASAEGKFNEVRFPQDRRNCAKCHDGSASAANKTADGDNWKKVPSRLACGGCHDGINFATGGGTTLAGATTGHVGGAKADDSQCGLCHDATTIPVYHAVTVATPHNSTVVSGVSAISYDIKSVTLNASSQPVITFKITKDGSAVTTLATPTLVTNAAGSQVVSPSYEAIANFAGGPSLYVMYAVAQDGIAAPADFNGRVSASLTNMLLASGTLKAGTCTTTADANGYFTATLTGTAAAPIVIPAGAKMVTGAIIGTFVQKNVTGYPYTPANVSVTPNVSATGGVIVKPVLKQVLATVSGNAARRTVVAAAKCNACHDQLGTAPEFHGGARNDPTACAFCHTVNQAGSGGWAADASTFIHGIHGASKRTVPFTWHATATYNYSMLGYPGVLKNCEQCHLPNTVNFGANGATLAPNLLWTTVASGTTVAAGVATSPYVAQTAGTVYGANFSVSSAGVTTPAGTATLVNSPIASACFACHDTSSAKAHMVSNGGSIYEARSTAFTKTESCLVCHGAGKIADVAAVHQ